MKAPGRTARLAPGRFPLAASAPHFARLELAGGCTALLASACSVAVGHCALLCPHGRDGKGRDGETKGQCLWEVWGDREGGKPRALEPFWKNGRVCGKIFAGSPMAHSLVGRHPVGL